MKKHEALEILASVLKRMPMNMAEAAGVNAALSKLKEALIEADPLSQLDEDERKP